ncbi:MAG TPA: single-stranded-DNA-specific exonuclease RecJ, partial [Terriglobia bacterium]|nr:single-stranded-DNA-specific exonuclease RecJ [Terriglobia bacterium]
LDHLHDPFLMRDMPAAVSRLSQAIASHEKVLIYGDYDVDGMMATVVLLTALRSCGAQVEAYIPNRFADGYGMRPAVIERIAQQGYRLVISVDTGVREHEALGRARSLGIDCIVTDHHLPGPELPEACAILNPNRADCGYPDKHLSGVGVAFKLAQAVLGKRLSKQTLKSYLKVVAIGSIADVAPLLGENRTIVRFGLGSLADSAVAAPGSAPGRIGLSALLGVSGLAGRAISAGDIAFRLAPRLNAAGRMDDARDVIVLFTDASPDEAQKTAERLEELNRQRQLAEQSILAAIKEQVKVRPEYSNRYSLVFSGSGWHRGVIGIVAQRVAELYHRPALVIAVENGIAHGSGRSIDGFHLLDALTSCRELFSRYGGHAQAAGFSLPASQVAQLEAGLERYARSVLAPVDLEPVLHVDAEVSLADLNWDLAAQLDRMEPFGFGNPSPVFAAKASLAGEPRLLKEKHLKFKVSQDDYIFDVVGWGLADRASQLTQARSVRMAFNLSVNDFQGARNLQLVLKDVQPAG